MYRRVLAALARERGWKVHFYAVGDVIELADAMRGALGPPWAKDHRVALAATIVAGS
jgi:hypothetical protein